MDFFELMIITVGCFLILGVYLIVVSIRTPKRIQRILIYGSNGKMGSFVKQQLENEYEIIEVDIDTLSLEEALLKKPHLIIDFSIACESYIMMKKVIPLKIKIISGTTGFKDEEIKDVVDLAKRYHSSLIIEPNFSQGIAYIIENFSFPKMDDWELEINEIHHPSKKDLPSGTAKKLATYYQISKINSFRDATKQVSHQIILKNEFEEIQISHQVFSKMAYMGKIRENIYALEKQHIIKVN